MTTNNIQLAVIGLGYVGLPLAVEFAKKRDVIGFDINSKRVGELQNGEITMLRAKSITLYTEQLV